jgi:SWI/SNF-related matrix-associated actin-dependent regulator 1 of chromatin subfamily A
MMEKQIARALQILSGVCNGATTLDGAGFNGVDSGFGKSLAEQSQMGELSLRQQETAVKMLQKYRKQLERYGFNDLPTMAEFKENKQKRAGNETKQTTGKAIVKTIGKGETAVYLADMKREDFYNALDAVKSVPGRRWEQELTGKPWIIPTQHLQTLKNRLPEADYSQVKVTEPTPTPRKRNQVEIKVNGSIRVYFEPTDPKFYDHLRNVKSLPGRKWLEGEPGKPWQVPNRLAGELNKMFPNAKKAPEFLRMIKQQSELSEMSRKADSDFQIPGLKGKPYPYQRAGIHFLEKANGRGIIGDDMGLGKTLQSLGWLQLHPEKRPVVIVVPATLKTNWQREITKWMTTVENVQILSGTKPKMLPDATIYIINYDILSYWVPLLSGVPKVVIADEAHYLKNGNKTARGRAFFGVSPRARKYEPQPGLIDGVEHVILLTGTPITNRPKEIFPLLQAIDNNAWNNFFQFGKRYCNGHKTRFGWDFDGNSNLDELHEVIKPYFVRRTKKQVLTELPPRQRVTLPLTMSKKDRKEYDRLMNEFLSEIQKAREGGGHVGAEHLAMIEKAKQAAIKGVMKQVKSWVKDVLDSGEKLVIGCIHKFVVDDLMNEFGKVAVKVTGETPNNQRQKAVDAFQKSEKVRLFVGNIKAAGVGLTLTAASNIALIEFPWTPGDVEQFFDRIYRIGQENPVTAWSLVAENTIMEDIAELITEKAG